MSSNSNFNITKVTIDPVSQEITSIEVNGKPVETGSAKLQVGYLENIGAGDSGTLDPDDGYDGFSYVEYNVLEPNLENVDYDGKTKLNVSSLFGENPSKVQIIPSSDYDGITSVDIYPNGLTGYPGEGLEIKEDQSVDAQWAAITRTITIPEGEAWTGTITIYPQEEP